MTRNHLYNKYIVRKVYGETNPKAEYFVMRIDTDPVARKCVKLYADLSEEAFPDLANDIRTKLLGIFANNIGTKGNTLLEKRLHQMGLEPEQRISIMGIISDLCPVCWNEERKDVCTKKGNING